MRDENAPAGTTVEPAAKPQPPLLIPNDAGNVAPGKKITCSDKNVSSSDLAKLTDGDKGADGSSIVLLHKGLQWVQFNSGVPRQIFAVVIWHAYDTPKVCRSVIVQAADDKDFTENVSTLFNTIGTTAPAWASGPTGNTSRATGAGSLTPKERARVFFASIPTAALRVR